MKKQIDPNNLPKAIHVEYLGWYYKAAMTADFVYYCNYRESDENGNVLMYRRSTGELVSDNYFAGCDLLDVLDEGSYTWASRTMKKEIKLRKEANQY